MEEKEAPTPFTSEPEFNQEFIKPNETKKLTLKKEQNNSFDIEYYISENNIIFEGKTKDIIPQKIYKKIYSYENIIRNNNPISS